MYRKTGHRLSQGGGERIEDNTGLTLLHAHRRDAAQQGFYKVCQTARTLRTRLIWLALDAPAEKPLDFSRGGASRAVVCVASAYTASTPFLPFLEAWAV